MTSPAADFYHIAFHEIMPVDFNDLIPDDLIRGDLLFRFFQALCLGLAASLGNRFRKGGEQPLSVRSPKSR